MNYYTEQLKQVTPESTDYNPTIKIFANGNGTDTKHLSLNEESARALINWLTYHYPNAVKPISYIPQQLF